MTTKLFVGRLSFGTTDESLLALFEQFGVVVSARVATDRDTRQSRGFAFVEMESKEAADKAIAELDGKDFEGRQIVVNVARPREDRPQGGNNFRKFDRR